MITVFFAIFIIVLCRRRRLNRVGYVVVRREQYVPNTVITQHGSQVSQIVFLRKFAIFTYHQLLSLSQTKKYFM